ncbi:MAG: bifunctional folylpolyglutamate synthase/dihydrofolate synthase [Acidobacteriota bacterium]|nr:bifunctional folylpolyglutamate synthase/dihydrofolate synthase [Acidobacteriota bacterium]
MKPKSAPSARDLLAELETSGIRLGLDAMRGVLAGLGDPHLRLPHVLVAGTNGKGSTAALVASMLGAAGHRTGLYTSPHLEDVRERLRLDGRAIGRAELAARLGRVVAAARRRLGSLPTYFEALTAAAFSWLADEAAIAVMEVGLGGRLDATNVGQPLAALVTEIGIDHAEILGGSEREIALEKAGVMRPGRPALAFVSSAAAREVLAGRARELGAQWHDVTAEVEWRLGGAGRVELATPERVYRLEPPLAGAHQLGNLALAVRAVEVLAAAGGPPTTRAAIEAGVARCRWPGRLERIDLASGHQVLLDAAHNPQGAAALKAYLDGEARPYRLLFGALGDKDVAGALLPLAAGATAVILTTPRSPRAVAPARLAELLPEGPVRVEEDAAAALTAALDPPAATVVVCGSIYLVGEVRRLLRARHGRPAAAVDVDLAG